MKVIKIKTEYMESVYIVHNCTVDKANKFVKKVFSVNKSFSDDAMGHTLYLAKDSRRAIVIFINNNKFKEVRDTISTAYHEAGHSVFFMLEHVGIDPCDSSGEHFLYLQDHITQEILGSINKYELGLRKKKSKKLKTKPKK